MWEMFLNTMQLFFKGKLFREPLEVVRQSLIGIAIGSVLLVVLVKIGLTIWIAAILAALLTGLAQPYLFKNLKYR